TIPFKSKRRAQSCHFSRRISEEGVITGDMTTPGWQRSKIVEQDSRGGFPLRGHDRGQRLTDEIPPSWRQQQRPRQADPARQLRISAESTGLPRLDHAAQGLARIPVQVNELRLRENLREERYPQRVLRRLFEHPERLLLWCKPIPVAQFAEEPTT